MKNSEIIKRTNETRIITFYEMLINECYTMQKSNIGYALTDEATYFLTNAGGKLQFILPEEYHLAMSKGGLVEIYDENNNYIPWEIIDENAVLWDCIDGTYLKNFTEDIKENA